MLCKKKYDSKTTIKNLNYRKNNGNSLRIHTKIHLAFSLKLTLSMKQKWFLVI